jgi:hypothetical protein
VEAGGLERGAAEDAAAVVAEEQALDVLGGERPRGVDEFVGVCGGSMPTFASRLLR